MVVAKLSDLKIGDVVSWSHYSAIQPINVNNATVIGYSGGQDLRNAEQALINHANIYSSLPISNAPVADDYKSYDYIVIKQQSGIDPETNDPIFTVYEIGYPWIIEATIARHNRESVIIQIEDFDTDRLNTLLQIMKMNGFTKYSYRVVSG
jgi:hypothetical protein